MLLRSSLIGILLASLALSFTASAALGQGSNAGFEASVNPSQANAARIGQILTVDLMVANVANARQNRIVVQYDPTILGNLSFEIGDLIKGAIPLETAPRIGTDNLATIIVSAAQLGTSQPAGAGAGVLYTVSAEIISKVPPTGSALNFTLVQINASSQDTDIQTFAPGELGTQILPNYPNTLTDFEVGRQASSVTISWKSRFAGLDDLVRFRPLGETVWRTGENPLKNRFDPELLEVARFLASEGVDPNNTDLEEVLAALQRGGFSVPLESAAAYSMIYKNWLKFSKVVVIWPIYHRCDQVLPMSSKSVLLV